MFYIVELHLFCEKFKDFTGHSLELSIRWITSFNIEFVIVNKEYHLIGPSKTTKKPWHKMIATNTREIKTQMTKTSTNVKKFIQMTP